jgi:2-dehydropantoate 2-reductase
MTSNQAVGPVWPTDKLLADPKWVQLLRELMLEVVAAARARGHPLEPHLADEQLQLTRSMGPYKASTLLDFENGKPLELQSLFLEPLRQAVAAGALVPRIASLCGILQALHDRMSAG